jgi:hypothetical protein
MTHYTPPLNIVYLSCEKEPIKLEPDDRRYLVSPTPLKNRSIGQLKTREQRFVEARLSTHINLKQLSLKHSVSPGKMLLMLPKPDETCPYGNHTRLWLRSTVEKLGL